MGDAILLRDLPLSWDCPECGAKAARKDYPPHHLEAARCKKDCPTRKRRRLRRKR